MIPGKPPLLPICLQSQSDHHERGDCGRGEKFYSEASSALVSRTPRRRRPAGRIEPGQGTLRHHGVQLPTLEWSHTVIPRLGGIAVFRKACALALGFRWPIVISRRTVNGNCAAAVGSCVPINSDGWVLTAGHILKEVHKLSGEQAQTVEIEARIKAIEKDQTIDRHERRRRLRAIPRIRPDDTANSSTWLGRDELQIKEGYAFELADIAVVRVEPWDPAWVPAYPVFKDPNKGFDPGTSLCRMGFPFHR